MTNEDLERILKMKKRRESLEITRNWCSAVLDSIDDGIPLNISISDHHKDISLDEPERIRGVIRPLFESLIVEMKYLDKVYEDIQVVFPES